MENNEYSEYIDGLFSDINSSSQDTGINADLDAQYSDNKKKHRNQLEKLDSLFHFITHPSVIIIIAVVFYFGYFILYCINTFKNIQEMKCPALNEITNKISTISTYFITTLVTYIATSLIDHVKRISNIEDHSL